MVAARERQTTVKYADIAVYSPDDELQLVVEVKNRVEANAGWAAHMRRNMVAHLGMPRSPFFLLALPDHFYLWRGLASPLDIAPPDYDIDPTPLLAAYVADAPRALSIISEYGLALAVSSWLANLVAPDLDGGALPPDQSWLIDSGLYRAVKGGVVKPQLAL